MAYVRAVGYGPVLRCVVLGFSALRCVRVQDPEQNEVSGYRVFDYNLALLLA